MFLELSARNTSQLNETRIWGRAHCAEIDSTVSSAKDELARVSLDIESCLPKITSLPIKTQSIELAVPIRSYS